MQSLQVWRASSVSFRIVCVYACACAHTCHLPLMLLMWFVHRVVCEAHLCQPFLMKTHDLFFVLLLVTQWWPSGHQASSLCYPSLKGLESLENHPCSYLSWEPLAWTRTPRARERVLNSALWLSEGSLRKQSPLCWLIKPSWVMALLPLTALPWACWSLSPVGTQSC